MNDRAEEGSALLLVVVATAAVSTVTMSMLTVALLSHEVAILEHRGAQARALVVSALDVVGADLAAARLPIPVEGLPATWSRRVPAPPLGMAALPAGCRVDVELTRLPGVAAEGTKIIDARARGQCGRGFHERVGRYAQHPDGGVARLY